jgi:hypothetical protein
VIVSEKNAMLRHLLASIVYHAAKALKDAPSGYPDLEIGCGVRTPKMILRHISGVLTYALSFYEHYDSTCLDVRTWEEEVVRFYDVL